MMEQREILRRTVLRTGVAAGVAGLTTVAMTGPARAGEQRPDHPPSAHRLSMCRRWSGMRFPRRPVSGWAA